MAETEITGPLDCAELGGRSMLAWLAEQQVFEQTSAGAGRRSCLEGLRLRALVALNVWCGLSPYGLADWSMVDYGMLGWNESPTVWNKWHSLFVWMPARLADGPKAAVRDWITSAGIHEGRVFRRITTRGEISQRSLDGVGIGSLLNELTRKGMKMGVINRQYVFDFSRREEPSSPVLLQQRSLVGRRRAETRPDNMLAEPERSLSISGAGPRVAEGGAPCLS